MLFKRYVAEPIGRSLGIHDRVARKTTGNMKIKTTRPSLPRSGHSHFSPLAKFAESCWRFTFSISSFIYGVVILYNSNDNQTQGEDISDNNGFQDRFYRFKTHPVDC
ncbi:unnamed protein product [Rotaria sp. Silwood2]|nr:unnamed protein product [Rotaria sp. Silwood2]CAF4345938.1 unnamed protein product [Rotaria sp. Silwood2]CAF4418004.1 unnamed protein product [Rotaria sp. Silwood2]